jgi:hypothetical protein
MIGAVVFGIAAAVFVFFTTCVAYSLSSREPDPLGDRSLILGLWLLLVALSAGTMYAVASGILR